MLYMEEQLLTRTMTSKGPTKAHKRPLSGESQQLKKIVGKNINQS